MKIGIVQMNTQDDKAANLAVASRLVEKIAAEEKADLIVLPEYYAFLGSDPQAARDSAETPPEGDAYRTMSALAARLKVTIHAGSIVEKDGNGFFNTTYVFGPDGAEIARYRKIHLFDVDVPGGVSYRESDTVGRGEEVVTYQVAGRTVGCSICYDLRFPELFRALRDKGAEVIVLPAAFTLLTGKDHWEVLLRARAIETQCWIAASAQVFAHAGGTKACYGHSMVIDPWGQVTAMVPDMVGTATSTLDFDRMADIRTKLPVANHHVL
jgi:predicted amidohydrolase